MANVTTHEELIVRMDFDRFPKRFTCKGEDVSPRVRIDGMTQPFLAILLEDHDAPGEAVRPLGHMERSGQGEIPENISKVERPPELEGAVQGSTTGGEIGYEGPCPPRGQIHRYELKVYGYDAPARPAARGDQGGALEGPRRKIFRVWGDGRALRPLTQDAQIYQRSIPSTVTCCPLAL